MWFDPVVLAVFSDVFAFFISAQGLSHIIRILRALCSKHAIVVVAYHNAVDTVPVSISEKKKSPTLYGFW
jgi:hypothetical protein